MSSASVADSAPDTTSEPSAVCTAADLAEDEGFGLMRRESLGGLTLGMSGAELAAALGEPDAKGEQQQWDADGAFHVDWNYPSRGFSFDMTSESADGPTRVSGISVRAPAEERTRFGIGIGSDRAALMNAYGACRDPDTEANDEGLVAGSIYGGVMFELENGRVKSIFIGAAAE